MRKGKREPYLAQRYEGWSRGHVASLGARVDAPARVGIEHGLFHLLRLPAGRAAAHRRRLGSDLYLGRRRRARQPGTARRVRHPYDGGTKGGGVWYVAVQVCSSRGIWYCPTVTSSARAPRDRYCVSSWTSCSTVCVAREDSLVEKSWMELVALNGNVPPQSDWTALQLWQPGLTPVGYRRVLPHYWQRATTVRLSG